jgi:hypothetical protein
MELWFLLCFGSRVVDHCDHFGWAISCTETATSALLYEVFYLASRAFYDCWFLEGIHDCCAPLLLNSFSQDSSRHHMWQDLLPPLINVLYAGMIPNNINASIASTLIIDNGIRYFQAPRIIWSIRHLPTKALMAVSINTTMRVFAMNQVE